MQAIKIEMKDVLKLSVEFWREFTNYNNADFTTFKKQLDVGLNEKEHHQSQISN